MVVLLGRTLDILSKLFAKKEAKLSARETRCKFFLLTLFVILKEN